MTKFKKQNALPCKFQKKFKGPLFHCWEISDHKYWWSGKTLSVLSKSILKPGSLFIKFLKKVVWKLEKLKSQNFKSCMFDGPVIVNTANWLLLKSSNWIKPNVWYLRSFEKLAIKMWFPFNFAKNLKICCFVVGESKGFTKHFFGVSFQKYVLSVFCYFCLSVIKMT